MSWVNAVRVVKGDPTPRIANIQVLAKAKRPAFNLKNVDWDNLVVLDFETYFDADYTLKKLNTSSYIYDERFKAQMVGVKHGNKPTVIIPHADIPSYLHSIDWTVSSLLCHNAAFDGFILHHHYDVHPHYIYDTLSMARGLHSNDIGAGLDEVAAFYGKGNKLPDVLDRTKGVVDWDDELYEDAAAYCEQDVELTLAVFKEMHKHFPDTEMDLIDLTVRMFTQPKLRIDIPRVETELQRELDERQELFDRVYAMGHDVKALKLTKAELSLPQAELQNRVVKKVVGSNTHFVRLLEKAGLPEANIPKKLSPTWLKKRMSGLVDPGSTPEYTYAFSKDDIEFNELPENQELWSQDLDLNNSGHVLKLSVRRALLETLVETRLAVKSTTNITRAGRFLDIGDRPLPVGYAYFRAHTGRWGGNNKMNMQNLKRGGELRQAILAPEGHVICVQDSGQIEARVNGWLWGQRDLLQGFKDADAWNTKTMGVARGASRDAYCKFADSVYGREITTDDKTERFVGKVCVLGLGFQMGASKFQMTMAKGALGGPPVHFTLAEAQRIVNTYRAKNMMIVEGWEICKQIIEDMATGTCGSFGPLSWEKEKLWLPNGMALHYPDLKATAGERGPQWSYRVKTGRSKIYGGLLCENIVQALARIIVADQIREISTRMRVVMITHDEIVTCVREENADLAISLMEKAMRRPPAWCPDIPLNCEGGYAVNYSK